MNKNKKLLNGAVAPVVILTTVSSTSTKKEVNTQESTINWTGKKIAGTHRGTIQLEKGFLSLDEEGRLTGGEFVIDMNSIAVTDLQGESKQQLEDHLGADDFFGVKDFTKSNLVITEVSPKGDNTYAVTADLTIKGLTHPVTFDMYVAGDTASAKVKIDRTKYGIRYGSGSFFSNLGDNTIKNNFELDANLKY